jgi:hypothetical protein
MMCVEESADQHVGFSGAAMVRAPVQALQFRFGRHGVHVVALSCHCERRMSR